MRCTKEQLIEVVEKFRDNDDELKAALQKVFSYPENIDTFSQFFFPEYIKGDVPDFHKEFYGILNSDSNDALAAPRGHAKSTTAGLVYIIWCVVNKIEQYIVYVSQNHAKTVQFITPLRWEFKTNEWLRFVYGNIAPSNAKDDMNKDREDCIDVNSCRIEAVSFEKNLRGFKFKNMRPTLIIGDDIEADDRITNPLLRQKDEDKLNKVIIPSLDIDGRFKMIGTILHLDSLLTKKIQTYNGKIYKAIKDDETLLWPERFTQDKLDAIKQDIGSVAFQQEYLNNPVDNSTSIIKSEWVRQCYDQNYSYSYSDMDEVYLGVDFAFSDRVSADFSAFVDIGVKDGKKVLLNIVWKKGMSINEQMDYIRHLHDMYRYHTIVLEENSIKSVSKDLTELNLPLKMYWTGSRDTASSEKTQVGKSYSKTNAINRLAVEFENKMWIIPYTTSTQIENASKLLAELTSWALEDGKLVELGAHPDSPIGMLLVNELLNNSQAEYSVLDSFSF